MSPVLRTLALAAALVAGVVAASCTSNPYPGRDTAAAVLYRPFNEAPKTLDPAVAYTTTAHEISGLVNATLLEYHYLRRPYTLIPGLARAVPEPAHHGTSVRYRFELREDLLYQDDPCFEAGGAGRRTRAVVAEDVAFQLMRLADPDVNSPAYEAFANVRDLPEFRQRLTALRGRDPQVAALPAQEQYARAGRIAGVRTPSPRVLEVELAQPYPQLLYWFAMPFTAPMPWEAVAYYDGQGGRDHLADHPVGAGPYRLAHYDKQSRIVLVKNENWHGIRHPEWKAPGTVFPSDIPAEDRATIAPDVAGRPLPSIERIELRREKESIPAFTKFLQGYYDASGIARESFDRVVRNDALSPEMADRGMTLRKTVEPAIYYLGFNMDDPTVGAPAGERGRKLRQAMSLVVDAEELLRLFLNGRGIPAQGVVPPGIFGYEAGYRNPNRTVDLARARQLLAEAGYERGLDRATGKPLRLTFDTADTSPEGALLYMFYIEAWRTLGIDVELASTNYNRFQDKMRKGAFQLFTWGWVADYPDPENFYFLLWSKMSRKHNDGPNTANFADPAYDALFLRMKTMENTPERLALIREMRALLEHQCPWVPLFHPERYGLYHGWLRDVKPMGMSTPNEKYYRLDAAARAERRREWNRPVLWPAFVLAALLIALVVPGILTFYRERQ